MELRVLRYFLAVAREENITRAAELLHMTQPTLSRQIHQLEDELQTKLIHRGKHSISLTEEGMLFRRRAQDIVDLADKTQLEFVSGAEETAGEITIGCGETRNMGVLAEWMAEFRILHPLVTFHIMSGSADFIMERMEKGIVDIGLLMEPVDLSRYELRRMPYREFWCLITSKDNPLAQMESLNPEDLLRENLILPGRLTVQHKLREWFEDSYENLQIAATYNLYLNAIFMVEKGVGSALSYDVGLTPHGLRCIPLEDSPQMGAVLAWKKQIAFSKATKEFLTFCSDALEAF